MAVVELHGMDWVSTMQYTVHRTYNNEAGNALNQNLIFSVRLRSSASVGSISTIFISEIAMQLIVYRRCYLLGPTSDPPDLRVKPSSLTRPCNAQRRSRAGSDHSSIYYLLNSGSLGQHMLLVYGQLLQRVVESPPVSLVEAAHALEAWEPVIRQLAQCCKVVLWCHLVSLEERLARLVAVGDALARDQLLDDADIQMEKMIEAAKILVTEKPLTIDEKVSALASLSKKPKAGQVLYWPNNDGATISMDPFGFMESVICEKS